MSVILTVNVTILPWYEPVNIAVSPTLAPSVTFILPAT
ncbi:hypothetical protein BD780_004322 [Clostridium tetanomorphum]|nr:hypothetical protein [Clostridium tetanomorphum]